MGKKAKFRDQKVQTTGMILHTGILQKMVGLVDSPIGEWNGCLVNFVDLIPDDQFQKMVKFIGYWFQICF